MITETKAAKCENCLQGYTRRGLIDYADHIELCSFHATTSELLKACVQAELVIRNYLDIETNRPAEIAYENIKNAITNAEAKAVVA